MASEQKADPLVNRDTPIPVVSVTGPDDQPSTASGVRTPIKNNGAHHRLSPSKLKEKLESLGSTESPSRVSDRIFTLLLSSVLPSGDLDEDQNASPHVQVKDRRSRTYVNRPNFSLPVMSSNFRRFNSRIGVAFVAQNRAIRLFTWRTPTHTLSFLFVYTFLCIDPTLLAVLPLACCLFFIMVPAYLARHPPPPTHLPTDLYPLDGPPLAAARTVKPAPELSKDFFRNMRDLQNVMEDFSRAHDAIIAFLTPLTNFSNEALSSLLYILLMFISCSLFIFSYLIPWRFVFLLAGYTLTALGHPAVQDFLAPPTPPSSSSTSEASHSTTPAGFLSAQNDALRSHLLTLSAKDITLTTSPETRLVEIFELQHRPLHSPSTAEYEPYLFSPSTYAPMSPSRIAGDRPKGCPFFEDVLPPRGWRWVDKKWTLDLLSREWVEERCVTGVEVEIEGERWVTDLVYEELENGSGTDGASVYSGYSRHSDSGGGGSNNGVSDGKKKLTKPGPNKEREKEREGQRDRGSSGTSSQDEKEVLRRAWAVGRPSRMGEWRRRRWVRAVERVPVY